MQALLLHLYFARFKFLQSNRIWGRGGALIAEPIHCTGRYPPGEWDACSTTHSYFLGVTLSGSLTWFEEMRIFLSFSLSVSLSLSFLPHSPSRTSSLVFVYTDRQGWEEGWMRWQLRAGNPLHFLSLIISPGNNSLAAAVYLALSRM